MKTTVYRYSFGPELDMDDIEETLTLAVLAAENLHGRARVRMDGSFRLDRRTRSCNIGATTVIGQQISQLFAGFLGKEFGEGAFTVQRLARTL